ncbi:MAG: hypothetical protein A2Z97_06890 [Bdellovibrionales bacterium GWB1_52_6]|nr:MAG: hypothetical protein A2Z97_06890 [Bdellovibrionales bacterium GWB1_52_6]
MKVALLFPNLDGSPQTLDLGVLYLATYIQQKTPHQLQVIDPTFHRRHWEEYVKERILELQPDVLAISILSIYFGYAKEIIRDIKKYWKGPIIVGGYQAIMLPEETIAAEEIDVICTGEGELTLAHYLDTLQAGGSMGDVPGIWYKKDGKVIKNPARPLVKNLDTLPTPDYDVFEDLDRYLFFLQRLYFVGTRGCPYRCTFCAETALEDIFSGTRFRERDPRNYAREIKFLYQKYHNRGMKAAHLFDAVFTFNKKWLSDFVDEYTRDDFHKRLPYTAFVRPDAHNASDEIMDLLAQSNCLQVRMGVESGNDSFRKEQLKKAGCDNESMLKLFAKFNQRGILVKTFAILGFPGDSREQIDQTYRFCKDVRIQVAFFLSYTPIPGTPMALSMENMHTSKNEQKYSFHYSGGAVNPGVPGWYVPLVLWKAYLYYGLRLAWTVFKSAPVMFLPKVLPRVLLGLAYGCQLKLAVLYALINPYFWPGIVRQIRPVNASSSILSGLFPAILRRVQKNR